MRNVGTSAGRVDILLATYNGERFLGAQLDSLLAQTYGNWRLLVRDDGSTDGTPAILAEFARQHPERVIVRKNSRNLGVLITFSLLLEEADTNWIMLCDQDDVWLPGKIEKTLAAASEAERRFGEKTPLLLHTDLKVVDENLEPIADSLWHYQKSDPERGSQLNRLMLQNPTTGCATVINRALRDLARPVPAEALMHDWWLALTAVAFGRIEHLAEPTILYRQHGRNVAGAKGWGMPSMARKLSRMGAVREEMRQTQRQAGVFLERFGARLNDRTAAIFRDFSTLGAQGFWTRKRNIFRHGLWYTGVLRNLGWLLMA